MKPPSLPLPYFVKAAVICNLDSDISTLELSNNLIFAFFVFSLPLPPLIPPLFMS